MQRQLPSVPTLSTSPAPAAYKYLPSWYADGIRGLRLAARRPMAGPRIGRHRSPHQGASVEFAEYRRYAPGDSVARIDWAVYARSDRYVVRQYVEETNLRALVLLDTSGSMGYRHEAERNKLDYACYLAAGLAFLLVSQGDHASLMCYDAAPRPSLGPAGSLEGLRPLLIGLEGIAPAGASATEKALEQAALTLPARSLVILISDLLQEPAPVLRGLERLHHEGHEVRVLHLLDPGELHLPAGAWAELQELESGASLAVNLDEIRPAYRHAVEGYLEEVRRGCANACADYRLIPTTTPLESALHFIAPH